VIVPPERITPDLKKKKFLLSFAPQEIHRSSTGFQHQGSSLTQLVRQITLSLFMRITLSASTAALTWLMAAGLAFAEPATLFRVFLNDGTALVSYGEYARIGDRLVFSMPIGSIDAAASPNLHVVNLPMSSVNWTATQKYADSARYSHYVETSAESDYAALAGEVAAALNAISLTKEARARLDLAVAARRRLASWPKEHFEYRAADVREMLNLLDEAISSLRVEAGQTSFAIDLVAPIPVPDKSEPAMLLRAPTAVEAITHAIAAAHATDTTVERVALLRKIATALDDAAAGLPKGWSAQVRRWVSHTIDLETRADKSYGRLTSETLKRAEAAAERADVRGVQRVLDGIARRDVELGRRRPEEVNMLIEQVRVQLDSARRLRLARDRWAERVGTFRTYRRAVAPILEGMRNSHRALDDVRNLSGSNPASLVSLGDDLRLALVLLDALPVPDELKPSHALLVSAVTLAQTAVTTRRQAVLSGEIRLAWDASSAAAGSIILLERAREDMEAAVRLPEIR
jgi:hypothetical protein